MSSFGSIRIRKSPTPKKKVCNFVGGVCSPLLANVALDGMERLFDAEEPNGHPKKPSWKKGLNKGISLIRYADDVVAIAPSREVLEQHVLPRRDTFLAHRGRHLSEGKTRIVQSTAGCNFLGFEIRRFQRALLTHPQKEKMIGHYQAIKTFLDQHKQSPAVQVIRDLTPKIRGWSNYYRHCAAKRAFRKLDHLVWHALWNGQNAVTRTSQRNGSNMYFRTVGNRQGVFAEQQAQILWYQDTPITRCPKVRGKSSPMNPDLNGAILGTTGTMAPEGPHHQTAEKKHAARPRLSLRALQSAFLQRRSDRRSSHHAQTRGRRRSPGEPDACASVVSSGPPPTTWIQSSRGLSRVRGDSHARFLGGWGVVTRPGYPALSGAAEPQRSAS